MTATPGPFYIGTVKRAPHRGDAYNFASVEPLIQSDSTASRWVGPVLDGATRFPKRGYVHWHDAPTGLQAGSLWQFTIDEHPYAEREDRQEQYQLQEPQEPIEVLDLRGWTDEAALRSTITGDGIPLTPAPLARRVLLWIASGVCVGPLLLKPGSVPSLWAIDVPEAPRDLARMPVCRPSDAEINSVPIDGGRWFISPQIQLGQSADIQNWMSDARVARTILARLRKMDPDLVRAIGATDNLFREYLDHVESGRMGRADPAVERARADRLRGFREAIDRDAALLNEAAESLLATEAVRTEVDRRVESKIIEEVQARQAEVAAAVEAEKVHLSRLEQEVVARKAEHAELDMSLLDKRRELEATVASFDQSLSERLEEIALRPAAFFAEIAVLRAVLSPDRTEKGAAAISPTPTVTSVASPANAISRFGDPTPELEDDTAVRRALVAHATAEALSLHSMLGLHAAFTAGALPLVAGSRGYDLLLAYASAVAGGRIHWIPVSSSTMEPHDLLGRFDAISGRILPSPHGLLDILKDARSTGRMHVIALQGFNCAPSEAYLAPILEVVRAGRVDDTVRVLSLAHPDLIGQDDPYRDMARLTWPSSVLIACMPTDGSVTLPVPPSVWRFIALVDADDDRAIVPALTSDTVGPDVTEVSPMLWKSSVAMANGFAAADDDVATALVRALSLSRRDAADAVRVRDVLGANGVPLGDATAISFAATIVARSGAEAHAVEEAINAVGVGVPGWQTVLAEAQRLRT